MWGWGGVGGDGGGANEDPGNPVWVHPNQNQRISVAIRNKVNVFGASVYSLTLIVDDVEKVPGQRPTNNGGIGVRGTNMCLD